MSDIMKKPLIDLEVYTACDFFFNKRGKNFNKSSTFLILKETYYAPFSKM